MPWKVKRELHALLRDSVPGPEILRWLHAQPEAAEVLRTQWDGATVTAQNLSDYRHSTEYSKWLESQQRLEDVQLKTEFVIGLSHEAGLELSDAADAVTTSKILELMETAKPEEVVALTEVLARLRKATVERSAQALREKDADVRRARLDLDTEKFRRQTVAMFLKFAQTPEAQDILGSGKSKTVQMDLLHQLMFGTQPTATP